MAQRTVTVCDLHEDVVEATAHVRLGIGSDERDLDLCAEHLEQLQQSLSPFLSSGDGSAAAGGRQSTRAQRGSARGRRKSTEGAAGRRPRGRSSRRRSTSGASLAHSEAVRQWAREQGFDVRDRGRLSAEVVERYQQAHAVEPPPDEQQPDQES